VFDVNISTKEWYTGDFLIDADEDGAVDDTVYFSVYDEDSNGVFDSVELSLSDTTFGEGDLENADVLIGDDETLNSTGGDLGPRGPDDFGYTWTDKAQYDWIEINESGTDLNLGDDDYQWQVNMGFDFVYYGETFNKTSIASNGWVSFNETNDGDMGWYPDDVPDSDWYEGAICIMCMDLDPRNGGDIYYETNGTAPNRYFVVEYEDIQNYGGGNAKTAQIIFYESINTIKMQWMVIEDTPRAVGIENMSEDTGIGDYGNRTADCWINMTNLTNETAYEFFPPGTGRSKTNIGNYMYKFNVAEAPSVAAFDVNMTSMEWFVDIIPFDTNEGGMADDMLFYSIGDTDSNGIFDTLDLSLNGSFGHGNIGDDIVNDTNGERYVFGTTPTTITIGPELPFTLDFDSFPEADDDDLRITALRWYEGSFIVDADDDGTVDDTFYYVLTDTDSNGAYETIDISFVDQTYGEGNVSDGNVSSAGDDERFVIGSNVLLGQTITFAVSTGGNPTATNQDIFISNKWTYKGNITFDSDCDGEADDDLFFIISDEDSDGIYDTLDLSFDLIFGEGDQGDGLVTANPYNDERLTAEGDVELGENVSFTVGFDSDPQNDDEDLRLTVHIWFSGAFEIDANDDGDPSEMVYYVLTDTDSDGFFDIMDLSLGDETYGQGNIGDSILMTGNDERISEATVLTIGPSLKFNASFTGSPGGTQQDATLVNSDLYTGSFDVDIGLGATMDTIYFVISDSDSDGNYDIIDLSLGDEVYREDLDWDGYVDIDGNDEKLTQDGQVRIGSFVYDLTYVPNPHVVDTDMVITSAQWFLGNFTLDADGDGNVSEVLHFLISDLDSNGLFETMDLSLDDLDFGEGDLGDLSLGVGDDEVITDTSEIDLGELLLELRATKSPNQNIEDAWLTNLRWYTGTIGSEENNWTLHYATCDIDSDGTYDKAEVSINDVFGQGDGFDDYLKENNDEVLMNGDMVIFGNGDYHMEVFINSTMTGPKDLGLKSLEWRTGRWLVEGSNQAMALSDQNSDMAFDTIHMDMNDDGSYDGAKDIRGDMYSFKEDLIMRYMVASLDEEAREIEMTPMNASTAWTDHWMIGFTQLGDTSVAVLLSDDNDDGTFETVDVDLNMDGIVDINGLTEDGDDYATVQGNAYQVIKMDVSGKWVRFVGYGGGILDHQLDISATDTINYGSVTEQTVGCDMNEDGDYDDTLDVVVVDISNTGHVSLRMKIFIDLLMDGTLVNDEAMSLGSTFSMGGTEWQIDHVTSTKNRVGIKRITDPSASVITGPDGRYMLIPDRAGTYWIRMTSPHNGWGYEQFEDTNLHKGHQVTTAGLSDKDLVLIQSGTSISGIVTDMITGDVLENVLVKVYNMEGENVISTYTLSDGSYLLGVERNEVFDVYFSKVGYKTDDGTTSEGTWHGVAIGGGRSDMDVSLMPDPAPDVLHFTAPANGAVVKDTIDISVEVTALVKVEQVHITLNNGLTWNKMELSNGSSYGYSWDTHGSPDGAYQLRARATNSVGLRADVLLNITVDNTGPVVVIRTAPEQYANVEIQVMVNDEFSDVDKVEVRIDGGSWEKMSKGGEDYYYIWRSGPFDSGTHTYEIRSTDTMGNQAIYTSKVEVDNTWMLLLIFVVIMAVLLAVVMAKMRKKGPKEEPGPEPEDTGLVHEKVDHAQDKEGHLPDKADDTADDVIVENGREEGEE
jgi:hypothetical protein